MSKCDKRIQEIADYIDGELDSEVCEKLEKHLDECENCRLMVDSMKQTVQLCRDGHCEDLPEDIAEKLNESIRKRWEKKFGGSSK